MDPDHVSIAPRPRTGRQQVYLHVGSPKTGTTFLQQVLWAQRDLASEQGLLLPLNSFHDHYLASIDVRDLSYEPRYPPRAIGIWTQLVEEGLAFDGNVLVSHELFAGVTAAQAVAAVKAWGDVDVHVVVTARDLERQIPAEWQEHIKHRSAVTFTKFVAELKTRGRAADWFWTVQDYADICRRWGAAVPPERLHVVTVPPRGSRPEALWERFAGVVGLDASAFDLEVSKTNRSLRAEQAELLRRVNGRLGARLPLPGSYPETVKEIFAQDVLAGRPGARVSLSPDDRAFALERSATIVAELRELGVDVVGELGELLPSAQPAASMSGAGGVSGASGASEVPESTPEAVLLDESIEALAALLDRLSTERAHRKVLRETRSDLQATRAELDALRDRHQLLRREHTELLDRVRTRPLRLAVGSWVERSPRLRWLGRLRAPYRRTVALGRRISTASRRLRQP